MKLSGLSPYIVDTSVWHKSRKYPRIQQRFEEVRHHHTILAVPLQVLELCHSAPSAAAYRGLYRPRVENLLPAPQHPTIKDALDLQQQLWDAGLMRAAGAPDVLIASYALVNDAVILCADKDYLHLQEATGGKLRVEYLPTEQ